MTEYWQKQAHQLANNFAKEKSLQFIEMFFKESGLLTQLRDAGILPALDLKPDLKPWEHAFGKYLALTYALGYMDGLEKQKSTKIYLPPNEPN
jgi:hypothetical protein